jgi:hypothetical protein
MASVTRDPGRVALANNLDACRTDSTLAHLNGERLDQFWTFIAKRQDIWFRRFVLGHPPPWTKDPILASNHFTNVYRELDPGTQYVVERILERDETAADRIFNVMIYRLIGKEATHESIGFQHVSSYDASTASSKLHNLRKRGVPPFTAAYVVSGYSHVGGNDKIERVCTLFEALSKTFDGFYSDLRRASTPSEAFAVLARQDGYGTFLAFQILVDLMYPLMRERGRAVLPFSQNHWARAGPGARRGISILADDRPVDELQVMQDLRLSQGGEFDRLALRFHFILDSNQQPIPISLPNIQNCLCEFYKYVKILEGRGRARRKFQPSEGPPATRSIESFAGLTCK